MARTPNTAPQQLDVMTAAIRALAGEFTDIRTVTDKDGQPIEKNVLGYLQKRVLNSLCYAGEKLVEEQVRNLTKAGYELRDLLRKSGAIHDDDGRSISDTDIARKTEWVQVLREQVAIVERLYAVAKEEHLAATGERYVPTAERTKTTASSIRRAAATDAGREALATLEALGLEPRH